MLDQSASSFRGLSSGQTFDVDEERDHTGWKKSWGPRRQFGNHPRAVWRPPSEPARDVSVDEEASSGTCWPSKTGMRRGNPKSTHNEDGTLKATRSMQQDTRNDFPHSAL
jgi:hypothetical protein